MLLGAAAKLLHETANAAFGAEEFFKATIGNEHTRRAYGRFMAWCEAQKLEFWNITPGLTAEYLSALEGSAPDQKPGARGHCGISYALVQRHAVALNPFATSNECHRR